MDKKKTGSYYTPEFLARFIARRVLSYLKGEKNISILEPSVGDGAFVEAMAWESKAPISLTALDINESELGKASPKWNKRKASFQNLDFLEFPISHEFSAVIGNPPYIKKNDLSANQMTIIKEFHSQAGLSESSTKNIWAAFVVKANAHLAPKGILAFVLPSELLQVKFATEIREFLKKQFERIEIFTFNNLLFECKGQDTIILFAYKKAAEKGEFFANIADEDELVKNSFSLEEKQSLLKTKVKWTHHFLEAEELTLLDRLRKNTKTVGHYCESKPGIVTAANQFFIVDKHTERKNGLEEFTIPIIQKGLFVNGKVVFSEEDFLELEQSNFPTRLLQLAEKDIITASLKSYLDVGVKLEIPSRYKCQKRNKWYVIPNIPNKPEALFFKRCHHYPKFLKNTSDAFVTDSAYQIRAKEGSSIDSVIYSFYNSLTLAFAETDGRYYGGGVLELTPSEFKKLPIPYLNIGTVKFESFASDFAKKVNIEEVLAKYDFEILNSALGLTSEEILVIQGIRRKLLDKRFRIHKTN